MWILSNPIEFRSLKNSILANPDDVYVSLFFSNVVGGVGGGGSGVSGRSVLPGRRLADD